MKNLLFIFAMLIGTSSFGQTVTASPALKMTNDTIVNATTTYAYLGSVASFGNIVGGSSALGVTFKITKVSGTVAATLTLQGSNNTVDWFTANSITPFAATDVATQTAKWEIATLNYKFYRILITPTGTQRAAFKGNFQVRSNGGINN